MINKFYYVQGGAERYMFEWSKILEKHGHQIIPFCMEHERNEKSKYSNYFVTNVNFDLNGSITTKAKAFFRTIYSFEARRKIERLIKDTRPDIAHIHSIHFQITPSILYSIKKAGIPIVWTIHEYGIICPHQRFYNYRNGKVCLKCRKTRYHNAIFEKCIKDSYIASTLGCLQAYLYKLLNTYERNVDIFITPSYFMREKMIEFGIRPEKLTYVPYVLNIEDYPYSDSLSDYFIFFGRLSQEKGLYTLLKAMKKVSNGKLLIVGEGNLGNSLRNMAREENIRNVEFIGYQSGERLKRLIKDALFMVIPSEWYDNSPLAIYESMAMGKPVVASKIGGIPELIENGVDGFLFEAHNVDNLAQKLQYLIDNKDVLFKMSKMSRKKVEERYNSDLHYERLMEVYKQVLTARRMN